LPRPDSEAHGASTATGVIAAEPLAGRVLEQPDGSFVLAEWRAPGCAPGTEPQLVAPLHVHHADDEAWYVIDGTLSFQLGDREVAAPTGSAVFAPRATPHTFWNPAQEPARYLLVMTPRILRLIEAIHELPDRSREALEQVFLSHESELLA
jgi:mannose-6-phosphate isomerase-like protein (cupin superfamily)